jgi:hypothetical protein
LPSTLSRPTSEFITKRLADVKKAKSFLPILTLKWKQSHSKVMELGKKNWLVAFLVGAKLPDCFTK